MRENREKVDNAFIKVLCILTIGAGLLLIGLSIISIAVSTAVTFGMIAPMVMGILMIVYAIARLKKRGRVFSPRWLRVTIIIVLIAGILAAAMLETLMNIVAYKEPPKEDTGFVIVLGCGVFPDGQLTLSLKNRLDAAYDYLKVHKTSLCIVSGGQGDNEPVPEAKAMSEYLRSRGIEANRILMEDQSDSTLRNLMYSQEIMGQYPQQPQTAAIVTSDYHVYRALMVAKDLGYDAFGIPAATNWKIVVACHVREYAAIIKTWLFGGEKV
jgi:uncharacterized SAM-binding protein YcdF (DUF218 family)